VCVCVCVCVSAVKSIRPLIAKQCGLCGLSHNALCAIGHGPDLLTQNPLMLQTQHYGTFTAQIETVVQHYIDIKHMLVSVKFNMFCIRQT